MGTKFKTLFQAQDSEDLKKEAERFYAKQTAFQLEHGIKANTNHYICQKFYQQIVVTYISNVKAKTKDLEIDWLFGKAMDIHIRHCMTHSKYIQFNAEMKANFYCNAMYRLNEFTINTYNAEKQTAFVYFSSTINNAFKEELNTGNKQKLASKNFTLQHGLDCVISNMTSMNISELEKDYEIDYDVMDDIEIPIFILELAKRYTIKKLSITEDDTVPRFKRKKQHYDYFIHVKDLILNPEELDVKKQKKRPLGVIIEYIDLYTSNEQEGTSTTYYKNRNLIAREKGHQVFQLFSDTFNDVNIDDEMIFSKIKYMVEGVKQDLKTMNGDDIMLDYIHYSFIKNMKMSASSWFILDKTHDCKEYFEGDGVMKYVIDLDYSEYKRCEDVIIYEGEEFPLKTKFLKREMPMSQDVEYYMELKKDNPDITRIHNCGKLKY